MFALVILIKMYLHRGIELSPIHPVPIHTHRLLHFARRAGIMPSPRSEITIPSFQNVDPTECVGKPATLLLAHRILYRNHSILDI